MSVAVLVDRLGRLAKPRMRDVCAALAVAVDFSPWLRRALTPLLVASQTLPIIAIAPLLIIIAFKTLADMAASIRGASSKVMTLSSGKTSITT